MLLINFHVLLDTLHQDWRLRRRRRRCYYLFVFLHLAVETHLKPAGLLTWRGSRFLCCSVALQNPSLSTQSTRTPSFTAKRRPYPMPELVFMQYCSFSSIGKAKKLWHICIAACIKGSGIPWLITWSKKRQIKQVNPMSWMQFIFSTINYRSSLGGEIKLTPFYIGTP